MIAANQLNNYCPYEIGDIYLTLRDENPSNRWSGTIWERIKDRFLLAAGDSYTAGGIGRSKVHTHTNPTTGSAVLTVDQMPSHSHSFGSYSNAMTDVSVMSGKWGRLSIKQDLEHIQQEVQLLVPLVEVKATPTRWETLAQQVISPYLAVYMWKRTA